MTVVADDRPEAMSRLPSHLALADWRRRIAELYALVRAEPDPRRAHALWRDQRSRLFAHHPMSPLPASARARFDGVALFDYDPALRFAVEVAPEPGPPATVDLGADGRLTRSPIGWTVGLRDALGSELMLWWIDGYGGGLFLPFKDATSGDETYGGGRYLLDAIKGADLGLDAVGRLILDFNFAYHPSCALNPAYVCPLAPGPALPAPVRGGERLR